MSGSATASPSISKAQPERLVQESSSVDPLGALFQIVQGEALLLGARDYSSESFRGRALRIRSRVRCAETVTGGNFAPFRMYCSGNCWATF